MEKPTKNLMKLTSTDIESSLKKKSMIEEYNKKLQLLRTSQIYKSIKQSTNLRNEMLMKLRTWITILEKRVFDPTTIDEMDINKVIGLFEYLGSFSLSLFKQTGDMDQLLKSYTDAQIAKDTLSSISQQPNLTKDQEHLKAALTKSFLDSLIKKTDEIIAVPVTSEVIEPDFSESVPGKLAEKEPIKKSPSEEGDCDFPDLSFEDETDDDDHAVSSKDNGDGLNKEDKDAKIDVDLD